MKKILCVLSLSATTVFGQDYYNPTDKDQEPLARFPINLSISNGVITYTLPAELTGSSSNKIELKEVSDNDGVRIYEGPNGIATCMGNEATPGCVVKHKNLKINKAEAKKLTEDKFFDPKLRLAAANISSEFDSGNEPIGFIGALKPRGNESLEVNKNVKWSSFYHKESLPSGIFNASLNFSYEGTTKNIIGAFNVADQGLVGTFSNVKLQGTHLRGLWSASKDSVLVGSGWFDFTFDAKFESFKGYYGHTEKKNNVNVNIRDGIWDGSRPKN